MGIFTWTSGLRKLSTKVDELNAKVDELCHSRVVFRQDIKDDSVSAQGLLDTFFLDKATLKQIKHIVAAVDPSKVKVVMDMVEGVKDGRLQIRVDLSITEVNDE